MSDTWPCEAYGEEAIKYGALCFIAKPGERDCLSPTGCHVIMIAQRQKLFRRMNELAAQGDEISAEMLKDITGPEELLGGSKDSAG